MINGDISVCDFVCVLVRVCVCVYIYMEAKWKTVIAILNALNYT